MQVSLLKRQKSSRATAGRLLAPLILSLGLTSTLMWAMGGWPTRAMAPGGRTCWVRVNDEGVDYPTIQAAVDAAHPGDLVKVAGYCAGVASRNGLSQTVYISKSLTLRGGYSTTWTAPNPMAYPTVLDAQGQGRVIYATGNVSLTVENLHIAGGNATGLGGGRFGTDAAGGFYVLDAMVTLRDSLVIGNRAEWGGGLSAQESDIVLNRVDFVGNTADLGGGIYALASSFVLDDVNFADNNAEQWDGGGVYLDQGSVMTGTRCTVTANRATRDGGGIYLNQSDASFTHGLVEKNEAIDDGAGFYLYETRSTTIAASEIRANEAGDNGGGVHARRADNVVVNTWLVENSAGDRGSALFLADSPVRLLHNTFVRNAGRAGIYVAGESSPVLTNTIFVSHTVAVEVSTGSKAYLEATLWGEGDWANGRDWVGTVVTGTHNAWGDPLFANPTLEDYHLRGGSPAVDAGLDTEVTRDADGDIRPRAKAPDLGADESTCLAHTGAVTYPSVQQAVDAAVPGSPVWVAEGLCYENAVITKTVDLEGGWNITFTSRRADRTATTINGAHAGRVISVASLSEPITVTIDGFAIVGGDATGLGGGGTPGHDVGGGLYGDYADISLINCAVRGSVASSSGVGHGGGVGCCGGRCAIIDSIVEGNLASGPSEGCGGGLYIHGGSLSVSNSSIASNAASQHGAGWGGGVCIQQGEMRLDHCIVQDNIAGTSHRGHGGGLYFNESAASVITDTKISGNSAGIGGGLLAFASPTTTLAGNTISGNSAKDGAGIAFSNCGVLTIAANEIFSNTAAGPAAGLYLSGTHRATLIDNRIRGNAANADGGGVYLIESGDARLARNEIEGNTAGSASCGGGLYASTSPSIVLESNVIFSNSAYCGGGMHMEGSDHARLGGNQIHGNVASDTGGGAFITACLGATLVDNDFYGNTGDYGAALALTDSGDSVCEGNHVHGNQGGDGDSAIRLLGSENVLLTGNAVYGNAGGSKGALCIEASDYITVRVNSIYSNVAVSTGGGLSIWDSAGVMLARNAIHHNTSGLGGGIHLSSNRGAITLVNNVIADNDAEEAAAIAVDGSSSRILHNTIARNVGASGVWVGSGRVAITNTIIVSHTTGLSVDEDGVAALSATLWGDGTWANETAWLGKGDVLTDADVWGDPAFQDPDAGDYHLRLRSAAVDRGLAVGVTEDRDGGRRPIGAAPDVGADEVGTKIYLPLVLRWGT